MKKKHGGLKEDTMDRSCAIVRYVKSGAVTPDGVERRWRQAFNCVLRDFGFPSHIRTLMWCDLAAGNWEHMHMTDEETAKTADEWLHDFAYDAFYCADRWSIDRLTRCHWMFRQYMQAATGRCWICEDLINQEIRRLRKNGGI